MRLIHIHNVLGILRIYDQIIAYRPFCKVRTYKEIAFAKNLIIV